MRYRLSKSAKDYVEKNAAQLYGPISEALKISINSVQNFINRDSRRLIEFPVLTVISNHAGIPANELIEEFAEVVDSEELVDTEEQGSTFPQKVNILLKK